MISTRVVLLLIYLFSFRWDSLAEEALACDTSYFIQGMVGGFWRFPIEHCESHLIEIQRCFFPFFVFLTGGPWVIFWCSGRRKIPEWGCWSRRIMEVIDTHRFQINVCVIAASTSATEALEEDFGSSIQCKMLFATVFILKLQMKPLNVATT